MRLANALIVAVDIPYAEFGHALVALLHFLDGPLERHDGLFWFSNNGCQQVRNAVIDRELKHLRINHDEPALARIKALQQ